ncbi:MAG TPA: hypothetical protein VG848_06130 [Acetobacteraceae bacterium]|nr:hypothetical protein [Acetobacteraceae bacterium]
MVVTLWIDQARVECRTSSEAGLTSKSIDSSVPLIFGADARHLGAPPSMRFECSATRIDLA